LTLQLLSLEGDYGLRAIIYLSCQPPGKITYVSEIARDQLIPVNFLFKILRKLVKHGMVKSYRGPHGGYALAREASGITFLEVIEAIDGPVVVNRCLSEVTRCMLEQSCKMLGAWQRIQLHVKQELNTLTIADLLKPTAITTEKTAAS
jgi:Rrf2 family iron-sulfur cluster assembly transcriptional regulator